MRTSPIHRHRSTSSALALGAALLLAAAVAQAWTPLPVSDDPLVRMPGTQTNDGVALDGPNQCMNCHDDYDASVEPGSHWAGSLMGQATRDPLFWAMLTVSAQDSIWALGRPNATDLCLRCHSPQGWAGGRSDPTNGTAFTDADFDGLVCETCHKQIDPHFEDTFAGTREGADWSGYWDETDASGTPSSAAAQDTRLADQAESAAYRFFNGNAFYDGATHQPQPGAWDEAGAGQFFFADSAERRAAFADANANHSMLYSRYHKSKYFCATCHDVSNPVFVNLPFDGTPPGDGATVLPSEQQPGYAFGAVERTFSEFMLSAYGLPGGAAGIGPYDPAVFTTSRPGNLIATCQDCHMPNGVGKGADKNSAVLRPTDSVEHPQSGQPVHDFMGGNMWIGWLLASAVPGSPNHDPANESLLDQGAAVLTMDLSQGQPLRPTALLAAVDRAYDSLQRAAAIENASYDAGSGALDLRIQNQTAHKLISGYPEGRRMFLNVRLYQAGNVVYEVNPYDDLAATLKGLDPAHSPNSPPLSPNEEHQDAMVYEVWSSSTLTGETHSFHMALADGRYKDNRIPPMGFRINEAAGRMARPAWGGSPAPGYFTGAEYAGGYDELLLNLPAGADGVEISLYYQSTSREFVEFLQDEINGAASSLSSPTPSGEPEAYVAQVDPFFAQLAAWGDTIWQLWDNNKDVPGAAPVLMAQVVLGDIDDPCDLPGSDGDPCDDHDACTLGDVCGGGDCQAGTPVVCVPLDTCHDAGQCNSLTGICTNPIKADNSPCPGGTCQAGVCVPDGGGGGVGGVGGVGGLGAGGVGGLGAGGVGGLGAGGAGAFGGIGGAGAFGGIGGVGGAGAFGAGGAGAFGGIGGVGGAGAFGAGGAGAMAGAGGAGAMGAGGMGAGGAGAMGAGGMGGMGAGGAGAMGAGGTGAAGAAEAGSGGAPVGPGPGEPDDEGGCGCRVVGPDVSPKGMALLGLLLAAGLRRRRSTGRGARR